MKISRSLLCVMVLICMALSTVGCGGEIGAYYYEGYGVQKDYSEAVNWWRKAADQNDAEAQYKLGMCYDNGFGVPQNSYEAVKWYRKAAKNGHRRAQDELIDRRISW